MNGAGTSRPKRDRKEVSLGVMYSPMRHCTGGCNKRKSTGQFSGDSTVCIRCARRNFVKKT
jgi:hypothetical protein